MESFTSTRTLDVQGAAERLKKIVIRTPLVLNQNLSRRYQCNIYLKREDLQVVRSYKIRGAYNICLHICSHNAIPRIGLRVSLPLVDGLLDGVEAITLDLNRVTLLASRVLGQNASGALGFVLEV